MRARGILNATGLNEGIVQARGAGQAWVGTERGDGDQWRLRCSAGASQQQPSPLPGSMASHPTPRPHPPTCQQGTNFETSTSPVLYESYLSRPLQAVFTGAPPPGGEHGPAAGRGVGMASAAPAPRPRLLRLALLHTHHAHQPTTSLHPTPPHPKPHAGNNIEVKGVSAYQYSLAPGSVGACNATLFDAWKAEVGFDEAAYQGGWVGCGGVG